MSSGKQDPRTTTEIMLATAEALERSEAILHRSAEDSPDQATSKRLHELGDAVTQEAKDIARRAGALYKSSNAAADGSVEAGPKTLS